MFDKLYRLLFEYRELYESRFEAFVAPVELVLIFSGFVTALHRWRESGAMETSEKVFETCEMLIFLLLFLMSISRLMIKQRKSRLGYGYGTLNKRVAHDDGHVEHLRLMVAETPIGHAPGLQPGWEDRIPRLAKLIADQASRKLSWRQWLGTDLRWAARERDSLTSWFSDFPLALWQLPGDASAVLPQASNGDYFSIVVPMTRQSRRSIRKGHRATDLAEIPAALRDRFRAPAAAGPLAPSLERLDLLAYLHLHVPAPGGSETPDESRLLMASIQHLAFVLDWYHGARLAQKASWNFTVLCESSNRELNDILRSLGFAAVEREPDGAEGHRLDAHSYAGFALFELVVENGECEMPDGGNFLVALRDMVARFRLGNGAAAPLATSPDGSTTAAAPATNAVS